MRTPTSKELGFSDWLARLVAKEERGTLAALRRGLVSEEDQLYELFGHLPPTFLSDSGDQRLYLMVAALFGYHPMSFPDADLKVRRRNLGESMRRLAVAKSQPPAEAGEEPEDPLPDSLKRRMEALLACHRDDLFGHLRQAISLLKTEEIPVDWAQLLSDLHAWEWQGRPVQWQWSRSFYVGFNDQEGDETHVS